MKRSAQTVVLPFLELQGNRSHIFGWEIELTTHPRERSRAGNGTLVIYPVTSNLIVAL
jgi:hypothetical protein